MKTRDLWNAEHICHECGIKMEKKRFKLEGILVRGWKCKKCHETILHPEDAQRVLVLNKLKAGIPVKVGELGSSLIVRLPKQIAEYYHIKAGKIVSLGVSGKHTIAIKIPD